MKLVVSLKILACAVSLVLNLAPCYTLQKIIKERDVGNQTAVCYIVGALRSLLWVLYNVILVTPTDAAFICLNVMQGAFHLLYIFIFMQYIPQHSHKLHDNEIGDVKKARYVWFMIVLFLLRTWTLIGCLEAFLYLFAAVLLTKLLPHGIMKPSLSIIVAVIAILDYGLPLRESETYKKRIEVPVSAWLCSSHINIETQNAATNDDKDNITVDLTGEKATNRKYDISTNVSYSVPISSMDTYQEIDKPLMQPQLWIQLYHDVLNFAVLHFLLQFVSMCLYTWLLNTLVDIKEQKNKSGCEISCNMDEVHQQSADVNATISGI